MHIEIRNSVNNDRSLMKLSPTDPEKRVKKEHTWIFKNSNNFFVNVEVKIEL